MMTPERVYWLIKSTYLGLPDQQVYWDEWIHEHESHWLAIIASRGVYSAAERELVSADSVAKMYTAVRKGHFVVGEIQRLPDDFRRYCDQIVRYTAIDAVKAKAREIDKRCRKASLTDEAVRETHEALNNEIRVRLVREVISILSPQARTYLFLHVVLELSIREISNILGEPSATVHGRVVSAKAEFRDEVSRRRWGWGEAGAAV